MSATRLLPSGFLLIVFLLSLGAAPPAAARQAAASDAPSAASPAPTLDTAERSIAPAPPWLTHPPDPVAR